MTTIDWENITNYIESVGTTDTVFPFIKAQSSVKVTASGARDNIIYTIGGQSGTLSPGQSVTVTGTISSMTLRSASGKQPFQVWATEAGTEKDETDTSYQGQIDGLTTQLAQIVSQNNNTITYGYDGNGNIQTVTEKDPSNNVIQTVTYTYNASGDVATSVTVVNGKTVTTTYNYDANGNITSTVNALS